MGAFFYPSPNLSRGERGLGFVAQEPAFAFHPSGVAPRILIRSDDSMARHDDTEGVFVQGVAHRARGVLLPDILGDRPVCCGGSVVDRERLLPHARLKIRPAQNQRQIVERPALARKVFLQLLDAGIKERERSGQPVIPPFAKAHRRDAA